MKGPLTPASADVKLILLYIMFIFQIFTRNYYQIDTALYPNEPKDMDNLATNFKVNWNVCVFLGVVKTKHTRAEQIVCRISSNLFLFEV